MILREYTPDDCKAIAELFYNTVHTVNSKDYTPAQLDAWAPDVPEQEKWNASFLGHFAVVAEEDGIITGFGDIDGTGYLDRLYIHRDYQRRGIASAICDVLEKSVSAEITTHASITAKGFFLKRGYTVIKEQHVERRGVLLTNYIMKK